MNSSNEKTINFYLTGGEYGCFSNFSKHQVYLKDKVWKTSEHYFQAQKFAGTNHEEQVRLAHSPKLASEMGRDRQRPLRSDWETIKIEVMREALKAKFTQHKELKKTLLETADSKLVEHTKNDNYWGDGGDGSGQNMLGKLLMEVREELRNENQQ